jgi:hypothetical protein
VPARRSDAAASECRGTTPGPDPVYPCPPFSSTPPRPVDQAFWGIWNNLASRGPVLRADRRIAMAGGRRYIPPLGRTPCAQREGIEVGN